MKLRQFLSAFGLASAAAASAAAATGATTDSTHYEVDNGDRIRVNIPLYGNDRAVTVRVSAVDPNNTTIRFNASIEQAEARAERARANAAPQAIGSVIHRQRTVINSTDAGALRFSIPQDLLHDTRGLYVDVTVAQGSGDVRIDTEHHRVEAEPVGDNLEVVKRILTEGGVSSGNLSGEELHNLVFSDGETTAHGIGTGVTIGADIRAATLQNCNWVGGKLAASAEGVTLIGGDYTKTRFAGCNFNNALLLDTTLRATDFNHADLNSAEFRDVDFTGANFHKARLKNIRAYNTNFTGVDLSEAQLVNADLRGVDLTGANLADADLRGADLRGVDLTSLDQDRLVGARLEAAHVDGLRLPVHVRIAAGGVIEEC